MKPSLLTLGATVALLCATSPLRAQDTLQVPIARDAVLRLSFGRLESQRIEGRLERSDSLVVRVLVGGAEGDPRLRAERLGLNVLEAGTGDSVSLGVPWRLVRIVEVASGQRSRRAQNGLLGGTIGAAIGGGVGAVLGATMAKSSCSFGSSSNCGISASTGEGAAWGALAGAVGGAMYASWRDSFVTVWTPLPDRGRALREGVSRP